MVVMRDRRDVKLRRDSTRGKESLSSMLDFPLSSIESSQSEDSSSSIALSSMSSSVSKTSSLISSIVRVATSSLKEVCFFCSGLLSASLSELRCEFFCMLSRNEFSSSADDPPSWNMLERALFFFDCCIRLSNELSWNESLSDCDEPPSANIACFFGAVNLVFEASADFGRDAGVVIKGIERYDEEICDGENPRTTLVALRSEVADVVSVVVDSTDFCGEDGAGDAFSGSGAEMMGVAVLLSFGEVICGEVILFASGARYE